ncbi:hypothetical protein GF327_04505 [Candidatus Woesearchaeota archaeon]|nr:hypothetical protein [Candidatus Woesearchaeota archaeon]
MKEVKYEKCPECKASQLFWDKDKGEVVCRSCGLVLEDKLFDFGKEWREFNAEDAQTLRRAGAPMTHTQEDKGLGTTVGRKSDLYSMSGKNRHKFKRLRMWQRRVSTAIEANLKLALPEIKRLSSVLNLPRHIEEEIARIYRTALQRELVRGHSTEAIVAGTTYLVLRMYDIPKSMNEVAEVAGLSKKRLSKNYKYVSRKLNIKTMPVDPINFVHRYGSELGLEAETQTKAIEIINRARKEQLLSGRSPKGIAAGALYVASRIKQDRKTQAEIARVADVTEVTVRNTYKKFVNNLDYITQEKGKIGTVA